MVVPSGETILTFVDAGVLIAAVRSTDFLVPSKRDEPRLTVRA
ncbi:MAG: hypothetical protein ACRDJE_12215 [Dehalococcoidia bacterium]